MWIIAHPLPLSDVPIKMSRKLHRVSVRRLIKTRWKLLISYEKLLWFLHLSKDGKSIFFGHLPQFFSIFTWKTQWVKYLIKSRYRSRNTQSYKDAIKTFLNDYELKIQSNTIELICKVIVLDIYKIHYLYDKNFQQFYFQIYSYYTIRNSC